MRVGERRVGRLLVADRHVEQHVAGLIRPDLRRAGFHGVGNANDGRQRRPVDFDRLNRIAGLVDGVRHHEGDGVTDMPHLAVGQDRIGWTGERIDLEIEQTGKTAEIADIGSGQDQADSRQRAGAARIDGVLCVRMWRAQHQRMQRSRRRVVVGIATLAANKLVVFLAQHALTDAEFNGSTHRLSNCSRDWRTYCSGSRGGAKGLASHQRSQPARAEQQYDRDAIDDRADTDQYQKHRLIAEALPCAPDRCRRISQRTTRPQPV